MTDASAARGIPKRSRRVLVTAAVALAAALAAGAWWATHPDDLGGVGNESSVPVEVGEPALFGMFAYPRTGSARLHAAEARVRGGSVPADVRVVFCVRPSVGMPIGSLRERAEDACGKTLPIDGQRLAMPNAENDYAHLVVEVVLRQPGEVVIDGLAISYSSGLQRGTVAAGTVLRVRATPGEFSRG